MKKIIVMFSILIIASSISGCSSKVSNTVSSEENQVSSTTKVEKLVSDSYEELDKLPQKYNFELAEKNGDVVNSPAGVFNIEKLEKFIENYKNKKENAADMVRITSYTTEGDAIIFDLIIDGEDVKLIEDITRDNFSSTENRKKTTYKVIDIYKIDNTEAISYRAKIDNGEERFLSFQQR